MRRLPAPCSPLDRRSAPLRLTDRPFKAKALSLDKSFTRLSPLSSHISHLGSPHVRTTPGCTHERLRRAAHGDPLAWRHGSRARWGRGDMGGGMQPVHARFRAAPRCATRQEKAHSLGS